MKLFYVLTCVFMPPLAVSVKTGWSRRQLLVARYRMVHMVQATDTPGRWVTI